MTTVVVLGMHRSGTSLVSNILRVLGVNMGDEFLEPDEGNIYGYWEDIEFLGVNKALLEIAGGDWRNPPSTEEILALAEHKRAKQYILDLLAKKKLGYKWGWKEPRTCLTMPLWYPYLDKEKTLFVVVNRKRDAVIKSLHKLHGDGDWGDLIDIYNGRVSRFLDKERPRYKVIRFEELINPAYREYTIRYLSRFVGTGEPLVKQAAKVVNRG